MVGVMDLSSVQSRSKFSEDTLLESWYIDSLSLMSTEDKNVHINKTTIPPENWGAYLGILTLNKSGDELWSNGNVQPCHTFLKLNEAVLTEETGVKVLVFGDGLMMVAVTRDTIKLIHIDHKTTINLLQGVVPDIELSNAELRLLMQILCGQTLRDAAETDNVSYETKRSQFKSLASRTGFKTQSEVIRMSLMALNAHVLDSISHPPAHKPNEINSEQDFLNLFYPGIFRFHKISISAGRTLRVADAGPINGIPVVFAHSQTLPPSNQFQSDWLVKNNIRLLIPFREGFLNKENSTTSIYDHLKHSASELNDTISLFCGGPAHVISNSCGAAYVMELARTNPTVIKRITFSAAAYLGEYNNGLVGSLVSGFKNLANRSSLLLEKIYSRYIRKMSTPVGLRSILRSAYKDSPRDMEIFDSILLHPLGHLWMLESYRLSQTSVTNDVVLSKLDIWKGAANIQLPTVFIHGKSDPINSVKSARKVCQLFNQSEFIELPDDGQSLFLNRFEELVTKGAKDWEESQAHFTNINE